MGNRTWSPGNEGPLGAVSTRAESGGFDVSRVRAFFRLVLLSGALLAGIAGAQSSTQSRTIEIITADRLELRRLDGQELVVISGGVELHIDKDVIRADRVEYNRTKRTLTLVGKTYYKSVTRGRDGQDSEQVLTGDGLVVNLASENLAGEDVIITTADLQIRGEDVNRVPGQLQALNSYFTPCARCGRTPNDYAFRARQVLLYPGDRLVAYDATLLLADAPVMYLPTVILLLNDPDRQPRFEIGQDSVDGLFARVGLPFVIGQNALGYTLLRYYQNRSPSLGLGVDLTAFDLPFGVRRLDLYALAEPRPVADEVGGHDLDFRVNATGQVPWEGTKNGLAYTLTAERRDIDQSEANKGVTNVDFTASAEWDVVDADFRYTGRFGPDPLGPLPNILRRPEFALDFQPFRAGGLSADFNVTFGSYTAASNPLSRRARNAGDNFSAERLEENHTITYETRPWGGATFSVRNTFTGRYYSTGARTVNLNVGAGLQQQLTPDTSFGLRYEYSRQEGTSPFSFDAVSSRPPSGVLRVNGTTRPFPWLQLNAEQGYDFVQPRDNQDPARFGVTLNPSPLDVRGSLDYDFFLGRLENWSANLNVGSGVGVTFGLSTSFNYLTGYQPLVGTVAYTNPDRSATARFTANYNLQQGGLSSVRGELSGVATRDAILNPVSVSAGATFSTQNPRITADESVTWRGVTLRSSQNFLLPDNVVESEDPSEGRGTLTFGLSSPSGAATNWNVQYGGSYDLRRGGWNNPTLSGTYSTSRPGQRFVLNANANLPGLDFQYLDVTNASLSAQFDLSPRIGLAGEVRYGRFRSGASVTDTLNFSPFGVTFALGAIERPAAYFSVILNQPFTFGQGVQPQPIQPIFRLNVDRCCWTFSAELNPIDQRVRLSFTVPLGGSQSVDFTGDGVQLPGFSNRLTNGGN